MKYKCKTRKFDACIFDYGPWLKTGGGGGGAMGAIIQFII